MNTYNISDILDRFSEPTVKTVTIQDLQSEIALLKEDIRLIKAFQELNRLVLQNLCTNKEKQNSVSLDLSLQLINLIKLIVFLIILLKSLFKDGILRLS